MNISQPAPTTVAVYSRAFDQAYGEAGEFLRDSIREATQPSEPRDDEILGLLLSAVSAKDDVNLSVSPDTFGHAFALLKALPSEIPLPQIIIESETEIGLDWDAGPRNVVSLTVRETSLVGFSALHGVEPLHGRMEFVEDVPETLAFLIGRLFPGHR